MKNFLKGLICTSAMLFSIASHAVTFSYVGNWDLYGGLSWNGSPPNGPVAYTGQEAAAFLFGGLASDYVISTVGSDPGAANHSAWYDVIGYGPKIFADNYSSKYLGQYYGPTNGYGSTSDGAASALVKDNAAGQNAVNYAFRIAPVPEPETYAMLLAGLGLMGGIARRRKSKQD